MVAVHSSKLLGSSGKAETPGVVDIMSCISSVCRLSGNVSNYLQYLRKVDVPFCDALGILTTRV